VSAEGTLVLGWGNPGRGDDGLGPALADAVEALAAPGVEVESDYQLQVEDAAAIARHERVLFVDAAREGPEPFFLRRLSPASSGLSWSSHSLTPGQLLALARELFGAEPEAWLLGVRGYEFDRLGDPLSRGARENLAAAAGFLGEALRQGELEEIPRSAPPASRPVARLRR